MIGRKIHAEGIVFIKDMYKDAIILWLTALGGFLALLLTGLFFELDKISSLSPVAKDCVILALSLLSISIFASASVYIDWTNLVALNKKILLFVDANLFAGQVVENASKEDEKRTTRITLMIIVSVLSSLVSVACVIFVIGSLLFCGG